MPKGLACIVERVPELIEDAANELTGAFRHLIERLMEHFKELDRQTSELEVQIKVWHKNNALSRKLEKIPGVGPITASAMVASVGNATCFEDGRQMAAWLGLVPSQHSSGGKQVLLGISKRGDTYLRTLLIHGARSVVRIAKARMEAASAQPNWLNTLLSRKHANVAAVALANKNARIIWALLAHGREYEPDYAAA